MKKITFTFATVLMLLCNIGVKSQTCQVEIIYDMEEWTQKKIAKAVDYFHDNFKDFDRECFLIGALDDNSGHYQTFTANKSSAEIDDKVKWLFRKDLKFIPDTMRRQCVTLGDDDYEELALFVTALLNSDYPDLRAFRVCSVRPFVRYYGSEIRSTLDKDPVCNYKSGYDIELFSPSLAKTVAGYYNFDYDSVLTISSGGDIGYRGVINSEKIATDMQKLSFLTGVIMRYDEPWITENDKKLDDEGNYSLRIPNSLSTAKTCVDILKEFGCENVKEIPSEHKIVFKVSDRIRNLIIQSYNLRMKMSVTLVN
jgi:hypothetical protein